MIFVWPRLEQDFSLLPESHYYDDWRSLNFDTLKGLFSDVIATRRRVAQLTANTESPSILEVGCGSGHALTHFRAHGWRVRGIDPWRSVTEAGRKYYGLTIETGRIDATNTIAPESQDIVMAIDVLQFTAEPRYFLRACFTTLKSGGMLYLTVPNFDSAASRREGWDWHYFIPRSYLSYFTKSTLTRLAELVGFRNVNMSAFGGREGDSFLRLGACRPAELTWAELGEEVPDTDLPPLDRRTLPHKRLTPEQCSWRENGYIIIPRFFPNDLIERYCAVRAQLDSVGGWPSPTAYLEVKEIRDLCLYGKLSGMLEHLLGEPMALHLTLTGWVSTERAWHQDDYLNPPTVNGHYAAVWTALDEIKPDCGPFEFVPGSHRWPFIRQANVLSLLGRKDNEDPNWPWDSERLLTPFFQSEIAQRGSKVERFLGGKGDILIWHPRLVHRGGMAERPGAERKAIITHYSAVSRRSDMPVTRRHPGGGLYFVPGTQLTNTRATVQKLLGRLRARLHRPS
jgi:2-polyprenyl-3-methyl-5-hydroxy-6-metoxy-1,4-benzoquinol methylase